MKKLYWLIFLSSIIYSCQRDIKNPTWEVDMVSPIAHAKISISNIVSEYEDDIDINVGNDSLVSLIFSRSILDIDLDTLLKIDDIADEKTHTLDSASFDDVVISDTSTIGETINQIPFGTILFPNGSTNNIPSIPNVVNEDTVNVDASEYFETMTLYEGMLIIEITNGYPTDISNISMSLINSVNLNIIGTFSFPIIPSGSSAKDSVSIAGQTLDENIAAILHNIDINESNGPVLINYNDAIITKITLSDIGITEATAIFPEQQLTESLKEHLFDLGTAEIKELGIKSGSVKVNVLSTLPNGKMIYNIPSLKKDGIPFSSGEMLVPEATSTELTTFEFNFEGYVLDLTGKEGRIGGDTVNTIYTEAYTFIDSTGELVTINHADSFYSFIEFDLTPEYAIGYLGQETFTIGPETSTNELFKTVTNGTIDLNEVNLTLSIQNFIGADGNITIDEFTAENTTNNLGPISATTDQYGENIIGKEYFIERASLNPGQDPINPTYTNISLEASNMLEILPDKTTFGATILFNPNTIENIDNFIYPDYTINSSLEAKIPLSLIANNLTIEKTITADLSSNNQLEVDELYVNFTNSFPLSCKVELILLDDHNNVIDTLFNNININAANTNNNNISIDPSTTIVTIQDTDFNNVKKIKATASFFTSSLNQHIDIYNHYTIDISLSAKFRRIIGE